MKYTLENVKDLIKANFNHEIVSTFYEGIDGSVDIKCHCGDVYQLKIRTLLKGVKRGTKYHCDKVKRGYLEDIICKKCEKSFKPKSQKTLFCSRLCKDSYPRTEESRQKTSKSIRVALNFPKKFINCHICNVEIKTKSTKFCSQECLKIFNKSSETREKNKISGQKGGKRSAHSQQRRSKNEVLFAEMCEEWFGKENVLCNEPMFEGWDADVIIPSKKVAVLWQGQWHFKQIMKSQSLAQVQARDKVKTAIIKKLGYVPYEVKDMGKYNPKFVAQEFECFLFSLMDV